MIVKRGEPRCLVSFRWQTNDRPNARRTLNSGFLQVRENWKKSGNLCCQGKSGENIIFEKSGKSQEKWSWIMQTADNCNFWHFQILKAGKFAASIERPKARRAPWPSDQGLCRLHIALLIPFHYLIPFMTFCDRVIVSIRSGKLSFHDWKSQGILLQKTWRNPVNQAYRTSASKTDRCALPAKSRFRGKRTTLAGGRAGAWQTNRREVIVGSTLSVSVRAANVSFN